MDIKGFLAKAAGLLQEEATTSAAPAPSSPLAGIRYEIEAYWLWRWIDVPQDEQFAAFVTDFHELAPDAREVMRARITDDDFYLLMTFARRSILAAVRGRGPAAVTLAAQALAVVDRDRVDWRDLLLNCGYVAYGAQRLGVDLPIASLVEVAGPRAGELIARRFAMPEKTPGFDREVQTPDGPVFMTSRGKRFEPDADLYAVALELAAALDRDGTWRTSDISVDQEWNSELRKSQRPALTGVIEVKGGLRAAEYWSADLAIRVAEAENPTEAESAAAAASWFGPAGYNLVVGRFCAVVTARSVYAGRPDPETRDSLMRFQPMVVDVLRRAANSRALELRRG